ncbi:pyrroline-5-carboxylate reductase [Pullulanibacillus pueri]|uniref:Pyrroline-5-carboxylate reductase n=1 Tax=Pullulanibacillus pueri TaxID=1437324 RepID=A0A8J2ZYQ9_9BACL|nr:pyrroline-5-carboxylate reductase ProG [Pullulanibacillus pueri]MBM7683652.1 pyrroline-5-carboxylate reductase [Pullulanibacillus pueri]GGH87216.1 pyrroline-5-carboxylate reductase 3 [Pullulanibacillus pueri]
MSKVGFIGYGSMSSMLAAKVLKHQVVAEENVVVFSRSRHEGVLQFKKGFPGIVLAESAQDLARSCDLIFICLEPFDVKEVVKEIASELNPSKHLISIAAGITLDQLRALADVQVSKLMPSLLFEVDSGVALLAHDDNVIPEEKAFLEQCLASFSTVKVIREEDMEAATNLTGSSPAYIAAILQEFIQATVDRSGLSESDAFIMLLESMIGTGKLLKETHMTFAETIDRVATKGGISEEGVNILHRHLPNAFGELVDKTLGKYQAFKLEVEKQ